MNKSIITSLLRDLVGMIARDAYDEIIQSGMNGRLSGEDVRHAIKDYPGDFTMPPASAFEQIRIYDVHDVPAGARNIEFDLWYDGEESDLTLSAKVVIGDGVSPTIAIMDIRVP